MDLKPGHRGFVGIADCPGQLSFLCFGSRPSATVAGLWVTKVSLNNPILAYKPGPTNFTPNDRIAALLHAAA